VFIIFGKNNKRAKEAVKIKGDGYHFLMVKKPIPVIS